MTNTFARISGALLLGATVFTTLPASAAPQSQGVSPMIQISSGGWASRAAGHRKTYDDGYGYGYDQQGYGDPRFARPYGRPGYYDQGPAEGYGYDEGDGAY